MRVTAQCLMMVWLLASPIYAADEIQERAVPNTGVHDQARI